MNQQKKYYYLLLLIHLPLTNVETMWLKIIMLIHVNYLNEYNNITYLQYYNKTDG